MDYFVFSDGSEADGLLFDLFLPAYRLHRMLALPQRHNLDRPEMLASGP